VTTVRELDHSGSLSYPVNRSKPVSVTKPFAVQSAASRTTARQATPNLIAITSKVWACSSSMSERVNRVVRASGSLARAAKPRSSIARDPATLRPVEQSNHTGRNGAISLFVPRSR
jgi:hypothetical protein